jgi:hypothetical protein
MDILNLKKMILEPKVYTMIVHSARGQILHLGVHFTLEEAYSAACKRMEILAPHKYGEAIDIDMWNSMPVRQVIAEIIAPNNIGEPIMTQGDERTQGAILEDTVIPLIQSILDQAIPGALPKTEEMPPKVEATLDEKIYELKKTKNKLMKQLILDGNIEQVEKLKNLLDTNSRRYVLEQIKDKNSLHEQENKK